MSNMKSPLPQCASMVRIQNILSGKWKITILWYISEYEIQRFGELRRRLGDITQSTLTKQLREVGDKMVYLTICISRSPPESRIFFN